MDYDELFKATLSMFALDANGGESSFRNLEPTNIQTLFKKVLEANKLCREDYSKNRKPPTVRRV